MWMVLLAGFIDPPGVTAYDWTPHRAALILSSGLTAFCVNYRSGSFWHSLPDAHKRTCLRKLC